MYPVKSCESARAFQPAENGLNCPERRWHKQSAFYAEGSSRLSKATKVSYLAVTVPWPGRLVVTGEPGQTAGGAPTSHAGHLRGEGKPLVLKGGTALLLGYNLERFSENLDFDLTISLQGHLNIESICRNATKKLAGRGIKVSARRCLSVLKCQIPGYFQGPLLSGP